MTKEQREWLLYQMEEKMTSLSNLNKAKYETRVNINEDDKTWLLCELDIKLLEIQIEALKTMLIENTINLEFLEIKTIII